MPNPSLSKTPGNTPIVPVRMPAEEKQAAKIASKLQGLSLSEFIRAATKEKIKRDHIPDASKKVKRKPTTKPT